VDILLQTLQTNILIVDKQWIKSSTITHLTNIMKTEFSEKLRKIMKEKDINQLILANMLDIRQSQISNWINGKSLPGYYSLKLLCEKLKINADYLLDT